MNLKRRQLLLGVSAIGAGTVLAGCAMPQNSSSGARNDEPRKEGDESDEAAGIEVTATEDLMREHGILRRILLVYSETALKLKQDAGSVSTDELEKAAQLFRVFGEDYHEKKLEEAYIFPSLRQAQGPASSYVDVLTAQHIRGREITDYILSVTKGDKIPAAGVEEFIKALESMVRMYEHHAAIEDTIIFPAGKLQLATVGSMSWVLSLKRSRRSRLEERDLRWCKSGFRKSNRILVSRTSICSPPLS